MTKTNELVRDNKAGSDTINANGQGEKGPRRYFEVFGDVLTENGFLKNLIAGLLSLCVLLAVSLIKTNRRPPLIIRMDSIGQPTTIKDFENQTAVTPAEVKNFTRLFLKEFLAWNVYTFDDNFIDVFKMMTPACQKTLDNFIKSNNVVEAIKTDRLNTKLTISEMIIIEDTQRVLVVKAKGVRENHSFDKPDFKKETIFEDTITIAKVPRTEETPWGMLVDNWTESLFKDK